MLGCCRSQALALCGAPSLGRSCTKVVGCALWDKAGTRGHEDTSLDRVGRGCGAGPIVLGRCPVCRALHDTGAHGERRPGNEGPRQCLMGLAVPRVCLQGSKLKHSAK